MDSTNGSDAAAGVIGIVIVVVLGVILLCLSLLPGIIASIRRHPQALPIWLITIFLGWTGIGWLAALIWSFVTPQPPVVVNVPMAMPPQPYPPTPPQTAPTMAAPMMAMAMPTPPPPSSTPGPSGVSAMADEITALARLRDQGVLTEAEFTARKRLLLGEESHAPPLAPPPADAL